LKTFDVSLADYEEDYDLSSKMLKNQKVSKAGSSSKIYEINSFRVK
jgi:hypothetical protein